MDIVSAAALCITVCIISQILKENGELKIALSMLCVIVLFVKLTADLTDIQELVSSFLEKTGLDEAYLKVIFKGLGICYISVISSNCCRDGGHSALASQIEIVGKLSMTVIALPLFKAVTELVESLLS